MNKLVAELKLKYPVIASDVSVLADRPPRKAKPKWPIQSKLTSAAHDDALHFVVGCRMEDVTQDLSSGSSLWPLLQANRVDVELVPKGLGMKELVGQVRDLVLGYYGLCEPKQDV
jgi:hypothetical protein